MNYFKLVVVGIVGFVFFIGDVSVGEAGRRGRRFVADPASASGPSPVLPIFLYGQDGPIVLDENMQQFVKVHYRYDKNGKLLEAKGKGNFKLDDGFGNVSKGTIKQDYKIIDGQAKLAKNDTDMNTKYLDGAKSKQNMTVHYNYDKNGRLQSAKGSGKLTGGDGFGNKTDGTITQIYKIIDGQVKLGDTTTETKKINVDGSLREQNLTVTYQYNDKGRLITAKGNGKYKEDNGFGNVTEGAIVQNYQIVNGQAKRVASKENVQPYGGRGRRFLEDPQSIDQFPVQPPPPSQVTKKKDRGPGTVDQGPKTEDRRPPTEKPQIAVRNEPQPEPVAGHCERGTWSPTLRICVEDDVREEVAPPDCGAGAHWSPTLKSCQSD